MHIPGQKNDPQPDPAEMRRAQIAALETEFDHLSVTGVSMAGRHPGGWRSVHQRMASVAASLDTLDAPGSAERRPPFKTCQCTECDPAAAEPAPRRRR